MTSDREAILLLAALVAAWGVALATYLPTIEIRRTRPDEAQEPREEWDDVA